MPARVLLGLLVCVPACAAVLVAPATASGQTCLAGTAGDEFTADRAGLTREWIVQLPHLPGGWRLDQVVVGDGLVVAQTSDGTVHAIQSAPWGDAMPPAGSPRNGSLLWSQPVGSRDGVTTRAGIGPDLVAVAHERGITGLERTTGHVRWHETFGQCASAGTAVIGNWVYAPTSAGSISRFAAHPLRHAIDVAKPDDQAAAQKKPVAKTAKKKPKAAWQEKESLEPIAIHDGGSDHVDTTPLPLGRGVLWCTSDGLLVTLQPGELEWKRLEFSLVNPPAGAPVTRDRSIFAATTTGDLARVDLPATLRELQLVWHAVLPGPAVSGPFLSGDTVVVSLGDLGIVAYSAETGEQLWQTCLTGNILAVGGGRIWFVDERGLLSALDLTDGSPRERLCLGPFTMQVVNNRSDRLILASASGMVVCLAPRGPQGTPTPADAGTDAAATGPAAPARATSDPAATPRP
ncbi:MAG: PQQ-binding-like beta-propeller repeat protein [Planctomycetia bacterium]